MAQMVLSTIQKETMDTERRLVVATGEGGGSGMDREFGVGGCKLLHLGWMGRGPTVPYRELHVIGSFCYTTENEETV